MATNKGLQKKAKTEQPPALWGWHTYLSMGLAVGIFVFLITRLDLAKIWHEVTGCNKILLLLASISHYATYPLRGIRWQHSLSHLPICCGKTKFSLLVFYFNAVDNVVPAKLGDVYGAHLARINCRIRRSAAMGSLVFLRMVDAWILLILALPASWLLFMDKLPRTVFWALIGGAVIAGIITLIILVFFLLKRSLAGWIPEKIEGMIRAFQSGMRPQTSEFIPILGLTAAIWFLEILWIFLLLWGFHVRLDPAEAVFLTMIPLLASAFPFTPSGAGVVEITLYSSLNVIGFTGSLAASIVLVNRFIDYWLHIILGLLLWSFRGKLNIHALRDDSNMVLNSSDCLNSSVSGRRMFRET
jgi:uncharacterized protein (TIRG00374 family)